MSERSTADLVLPEEGRVFAFEEFSADMRQMLPDADVIPFEIARRRLWSASGFRQVKTIGAIAALVREALELRDDPQIREEAAR